MIDEENFRFLLNNSELKLREKTPKTSKMISTFTKFNENNNEESRNTLNSFLKNYNPALYSNQTNSPTEESSVLKEVIDENPEILPNVDQETKEKIIQKIQKNEKLKEMIFEKFGQL
jgi:hypothetical protein